MNILVKIKLKIIRRLKKELELVNTSAENKNASISILGSYISPNISLGDNCKIKNANLSFNGAIGGDTFVDEAQISGSFKSNKGCKLYKCELSGDISLGKYTSLWGPNLDIYSGNQKVIIGSFCSIARNVSMQTFNHNSKKLSTYFIGQNLFQEKWGNETVSKGNIIIKNDVWIGSHCVVLGGVTIGNGAIVAANSVVTKDVLPFSIVAGTPAKVIGTRFDEKTIEEIETLAWWDWSTEKIKKHKHYFENEYNNSGIKKS